MSAVGVVISFAVQTTLARTLGATEYGTYTVVMVWMNVLLLLTKIDLEFVTTRFVGTYAATADWPRLNGLLRYVPRHLFLRTLTGGGIAVVILLATRGTRFDHFVRAGLLAVPLSMLIGQVVVRSGALRGFKLVVASQSPNTVVRPTVLLAAVWALIAVGVRLEATDAVAANVLATIVALLVAERSLRRAIPREAAEVLPASDMRLWLRTGYGFVLISAAQLTFSQHTDVLLVAALLDRTYSGYYSVATQLATLVALASTAVMLIVAPLIAELYAMRKLDTLRRFTRATVSVCMAISFVFLVGIAAVGRPLLGVFGTNFQAAYPPLLLLALSHFITASVGALSGWLMTMTGHERPAALIIGASAILNIALSIPLTAFYGLVGTATATLIATVVRSLALSAFLHRQLGLVVAPGPIAK